MRNSVYILSLDAKDIYLAEVLNGDDGYSTVNASGKTNTRKFINTLDYSIDLMRLRDVAQRVFRNKSFSFFVGKKEYSKQVINITFKYSVKEYNLYTADTYVKYGYRFQPDKMQDNIYVENGEVICIRVGQKVSSPLSPDILGKYFCVQDGKYAVTGIIPTLVTVDDLRHHVYEHGFNCDGIHYVRWKRSCGSSRIGKCLFINEVLYKPMHKRDLCGLVVKEGDEVDLAGFESYIALTLSSIIDTLEIDPRSILVIDDYDSKFADEIIAVDEDDGKLRCARGQHEIANTIWDGQSLIDKSAMGVYADKGMVLLRNSFFKSCCFNCNLQDWFRDNGITEVSQLNGFTLAQSVADIKLVTTPSSIKYLKFGSLESWLERIDPHFGVVKYDKKTHFFNGRMVQVHYQLLNSIQMNKKEVHEFLAPSLDLITKLRTDPDILRFYIGFRINSSVSRASVTNRNQAVFKLLGVNNRFAETKLYREFLYDLTASIYRNLKCGHVLVNGNYSTLCGNPIEMLLSTIGKFDGESQIGVGCVHSTRFDYDQTILGSRSPHITMSNVWLPINRANEMIDRYMNPTNEIIYINSISENVLNQLSGCDFDSDSVLLTDNQILIKAAQRNAGKFPTACGFLAAKKYKRKYCIDDLVDLDIRTSSNKIGEIVNLSQELNTKLWDILNRGGSWGEVQNIYEDICRLNVLSNVEIDKAKREFNINSVKELAEIRERHGCFETDGDNHRAIKPFFFAHVSRQKGYYNSKTKVYKKHRTTMDYLQTEINQYARRHARSIDPPNQPLSIIINDDDYDAKKANQYWRLAQQKIQIIYDTWMQIKTLNADKSIADSIRYQEIAEIRQGCFDKLAKKKISNNEAIYLLRRLENECGNFKQFMLYTLFDSRLAVFYDVLNENHEMLSELVEDPGGDIEIYGRLYKKVRKSS